MKKLIILGVVILSALSLSNSYRGLGRAGNQRMGLGGLVAGQNLTTYQKENLDYKKNLVNERVKNNQITREAADNYIRAIEQNQVNCDGTGTAKIGQQQGVNNFGQNQGMGRGRRR